MAALQPKRRIRIFRIIGPKIIKTEPANFRSLVQSLTGNATNSTSNSKKYSCIKPNSTPRTMPLSPSSSSSSSAELLQALQSPSDTSTRSKATPNPVDCKTLIDSSDDLISSQFIQMIKTDIDPFPNCQLGAPAMTTSFSYSSSLSLSLSSSASVSSPLPLSSSPSSITTTASCCLRRDHDNHHNQLSSLSYPADCPPASVSDDIYQQFLTSVPNLEQSMLDSYVYEHMLGLTTLSSSTLHSPLPLTPHHNYPLSNYCIPPQLNPHHLPLGPGSSIPQGFDVDEYY